MLLLVWLAITYVIAAAQESRKQCATVEEKTAAPHIFFINLDRSPARRLHTEAWLAADPFIKDSTRISAVDAGQFSRRDVEEELSTYATMHSDNDSLSSIQATMQARIWSVNFGGRMSTLGCGLSHAKAMAVAYAMGLEQVLIIEDDVEMIQLVDSSDNRARVWNYLTQLLESIPEDWDILQLSSLIYVPYKVIDMHNQLMNQMLWSRRNECSGDSFLLLGTGAYMISKKGMHAFLKKHIPQFLTATLQEAVAFSGLMDFRSSALAIISDLWIYDLDNVYVSHLPLFIPADVAHKSTVQSGVSGIDSTLSTHQLEALQLSINAFNAANMFHVDSSSNKMLTAALTATRHVHEAAKACDTGRTSSTGISRYALVLDFGLNGNAAQEHDQLLPKVYDVTTAEQRLQMTLLLESFTPWKGTLWSTLLRSFFQRCSTRTLQLNSECTFEQQTAEWVYVLIPYYNMLRAIAVPYPLRAQEVVYAAKRTCSFVVPEDFTACWTALHNVMLQAMHLYQQ
eukprot:7132-Heterococcus_DN1.PRE.2